MNFQKKSQEKYIEGIFRKIFDGIPDRISFKLSKEFLTGILEGNFEDILGWFSELIKRYCF